MLFDLIEMSNSYDNKSEAFDALNSGCSRG